ncbi:protein kinase [Meiothermus sp. CFH 77666]|uniref:protein kinase domain-containing protein n=1 Tax=Meiothermus sp. CFH 77666 TaxID=2817942 RepID=UPI001AA09D12|nr:protein kinase [Meiothermus sp. CFH 77666]MBO1435959.1 protein kinase [Meiothermus sp. CFH 77666]
MERCPYCASPIPPGATTCPACGMGIDVHASHHLPVGTRLKGGRYTLGKVLGQGGFGITYLGADTQENRPVAIKELFPEGSSRRANSRNVVPPTSLLGAGFAETMEKFEDEARVMAKFNHPGIVRVFDIFEENGTAYLVMEFLKGQTLGKRIEKQGKLPAREVQDIALKLLDALEVVHNAGMLHRDIKPDNVFLHQDGRVVLIDFGSARQFAQGKTLQHTRLVTPGYAPLEQYGTAGKFGPYTDLYALGATLYHALMGVVPPAATDRVQSNQPLRLPPETPDGLEQAVNRALEIRVERRPQSVAEFRAILLGQRQPTPAARTAPAPAPATGNLSIRVSPPQTAVRLQGPNNFQQVVQGDTDLKGLPLGTYTLYADARGFQPQQVKVQLRAGSVLEARFNLAPAQRPTPAPVPQPPPTPNPTPPPQPNPTPSPVPEPSARTLHNLRLNLLTLVAFLALFYLFFEVRPVGLQTLLQPLDQQLERDFNTWVPNFPGVFPWLRAGFYSAIVLGVFYTLSFLVTQVGWLLPLLVLGGTGLLIYNNLISPEQGALAAAVLGAVYLGVLLLERQSIPLAVVLGLAAAFRWADAAKGELLEPGGLAVAVLILCFGGIVRLTRERRREERNP